MSDYVKKLAEALNLPSTATMSEIHAAIDRQAGHTPSQDRTLTEQGDPRDQMTAHAQTEVAMARAAGHEISFTEGLSRARAKHVKLDKELCEIYDPNRR
jgi:hypothetical protein